MQSLLATIAFPDIDPVMLRVGPFSVRWYGVAYLLGFALAYVALTALSKRNALRLPRGSVSDMVSWAAFGVVVGGRAGWWLFYHRASGAAEAWYEPFAIWHGGMSFHGGLIGVAATMLAWSWSNRLSFWNIADAASLVAPIGLFFGRIANFINAELVGRPTAVAWGVVFPGDAVARHPSQLYEALLEGPVLLALLWLLRPWSDRRDGRSSATLLIAYGLFRFAVEFTREPDAQLGFIAFGWLTMGQVLSVALAIGGLVLLARFRGMNHTNRANESPSERRDESPVANDPIRQLTRPSRSA